MASAIAARVEAIPSSDETLIVRLIAGETYRLDWTLQGDDQQARDITGYTLTCPYEQYTATIDEAGDEIEVSRLKRVEGVPPGNIDVTVLAAVEGRFELLLPADLWQGEVPVNAFKNVPVVLAFLTTEDTRGNTDIQPIMVIIRYGGGSADPS